MLGFLAKLLAGPIVSKVMDLFKVWQANKLSEAELRSEVERAVLDSINEVSKTQASVIEAEIKGEDWLQRNWRPVVALAFAYIVFFYGLQMPIMVAWFNWSPVRVGDQLLSWIMDVVKICLGGYIGFRSLEKIVTTIVKR